MSSESSTGVERSEHSRYEHFASQHSDASHVSPAHSVVLASAIGMERFGQWMELQYTTTCLSLERKKATRLTGKTLVVPERLLLESHPTGYRPCDTTFQGMGPPLVHPWTHIYLASPPY